MRWSILFNSFHSMTLQRHSFPFLWSQKMLFFFPWPIADYVFNEQTETLGNKSSDRNQSATHLRKSPAKEFDNSHSEMVSNQASTSIGTNPSSDLQTGELFSTDFSSEISELHSSPSSNLASTGTVINAESEGLSPSSTDSGPSNHDINNVRRSIWESFSRRSYGRSNDSSDGDLGFYDRLLDLGDGLYEDSIGEEFRSSHLRQYGSSGLNWHSRSRVIKCQILST